MTDQWDYEDNDTTDLNSGPKPLRDAYKAQKKANEDLLARLTAMEAVVKQNQVKDLFESQGVPRSASKYYNGEATEDAVTAFVTDMRATFGGAAQPSTPVAQTPAIPDTDVQKLQALMQAGADGAITGFESEAMAKMNNPNISQSERIAAFAELARKLQ